MAKSLPLASRLQQFAKVVVSSKKPQSPTARQKPKIRVSPPETPISDSVRVISEPAQPKKNMEVKNRIPLADVVSDCAKRWFQDTLKEANAGDTAMQVLVGQMFCSGYGVPKDTRKGLAWINRASKYQASVWKASDRHPAYLATDSESSDRRVKRDDIRRSFSQLH
ncbi:uncharacterized protein LOC111810237 [Cucurbita pepo subsp. pepo]|uniref:uncharacterized protein LOC111810237 n=1 Tax=Cucurbita pepo subsp. pepo TaxID=3664 RepID=UPI000C9D6509|nr:uncharacterized protein LOC111810237 [Cucurbita pepo subsp. pepo]XP_023552666.1 uncharacterized protein LOC111810237 [Cucurbita pepo subsp. pepo]